MFSFQQTKETSHDSPTSPISPSTRQQSIFSIFREIKKNNEELKTSTYTEFWKQSSTTQHGLLPTIDPDGGLEFLEPKVPVPKSAYDYNNFVISFDTK